jgi:hypothetical protein
MFINVFTPHIGGIVGLLKNHLLQCKDRGCKKDPRLTKQVM